MLVSPDTGAYLVSAIEDELVDCLGECKPTTSFHVVEASYIVSICIVGPSKVAPIGEILQRLGEGQSKPRKSSRRDGTAFQFDVQVSGDVQPEVDDQGRDWIV